VQTPYTTQPGDAFLIAQTATAGVLSAIAIFRPLRPLTATVVFLTAIWMAVLGPDALVFFANLGLLKSTPTGLVTALRVSAGLATLAVALARPRWMALLAFAGEAALYEITGDVPDSSGELCALHLVWFGLLLGVRQLVVPKEVDAGEGIARDGRPSDVLQRHRFLIQDVTLAALAVALGAIVSVVVLLRSCDSADEWAYTYQAAVFAKLHAYGKAPACFAAFQSYWVFTSEGRMFSQYTPGWPLFMSPFVALGAAWLAAPFGLGLFVLALARLARRAAAGACGGRSKAVAAAGPIAVLAALGSNTVLINGASRYSHIFVCACFAWSVEALAEMATPQASPQAGVGWGAVLGVATSWMLATRPADGSMLGVGIFLYFVYALARRRLAWRSVLATAVAFVLWGGFSLVILRVQLGQWLTTGYSLTEQFQPWSKFTLSAPKAGEIRWGIPLATGSYCWWPLAPSIGLCGLVAALRGGGRRVAFMLSIGTALLLTFYVFVEFGRGSDFGYGPRYALPVIVPMAVGTAVAVAPLWAAAQTRLRARRAIAIGGPALLTIAAAVMGIVRLAPLVYPYNHQEVRARNVVKEAVEKQQLTNALVWLEPGVTVSDPLDLTQNYPLELYPPPDVLYVIDRGEDIKRCVREQYRGRRSYRIVGPNDMRLVPE
jgi:hypothetical protein